MLDDGEGQATRNLWGYIGRFCAVLRIRERTERSHEQRAIHMKHRKHHRLRRRLLINRRNWWWHGLIPW